MNQPETTSPEVLTDDDTRFDVPESTDDTESPESAGSVSPSQFRPVDGLPVRPDVKDALQRAVEDVDGWYTPEEWTFRDSTFLVTIAKRVYPSPAGHNRLLITPDCRTRWLTATEDLEDALGEMSRAGALERWQIAWLLAPRRFSWARLHPHQWHMQPVDDLGWLCSRRALFGRKYVVVSADRQVAKVRTGTVEAARECLTQLQQRT